MLERLAAWWAELVRPDTTNHREGVLAVRVHRILDLDNPTLAACDLVEAHPYADLRP